jgi:hypothetical protein
MALQKVKRSKALKNLLEDVEGKKRLKKYPKTFYRGKAEKPEAPKAQKQKEMSQKEKKAFREICAKKYKLEQEIHDLKKQYEGGEDSHGNVHVGLIPQVKGRISRSTEIYGRRVNELDSVIYVHPYKAQVEMIAGAIDGEKILEWARKNMPELIGQEKIKSLDLLKLEELVSTNKPISKFFKEALAVVLKFAETNKLIQEKTGQEYLDLEKYEEAKENGQVPKKLIEAVESEYTPRLQMWRLADAKTRCPGCGIETAKANKPDFSCDNCAFGLKMVKHS